MSEAPIKHTPPLSEEMREALERTADWLAKMDALQKAGPGKDYRQPRTIQVDVWDNCDSGGESVDGFVFDDGEVEYIIAMMRAHLAAATEIQGDAEVLKYVTSGNAIPVTRCTVSADLIRQLVTARSLASEKRLCEKCGADLG